MWRLSAARARFRLHHAQRGPGTVSYAAVRSAVQRLLYACCDPLRTLLLRVLVRLGTCSWCGQGVTDVFFGTMWCLAATELEKWWKAESWEQDEVLLRAG